MVARNLSLTATTAMFKKLSGSVDANAAGNFSVNVSATGNTHYVADDDARDRALGEVAKSASFSRDVKYYYIKESVGSKNVSYKGESDLGFKASASLNALSSTLATDVKFKDAAGVTATNKDLAICVVAERIDFTKIRGADGVVRVEATPVPAGQADYVNIGSAVERL